MFRLFLALNLLLLTLQACKGGYDSCKQKLIDANAIINETLQLPVPNNKKIIYSKQIPKNIQNLKILKHNPFLSLYLVVDKKGFKYPFVINMNQSLGCAAVDKTSATELKIIKRQVGLNSFAKANEEFSTQKILTNSCCALEGLVTSDGIIEKEYLLRFINTKENIYADVGARVEDINSLVVVKYIDPFMKNNPFKKSDCIISLNGKKVKSSANFMRNILFSKIGSSHKVTIKRDTKILKLQVKTKKRYGGGYISDTFLEQKGLYFSKDLKIIKITKPKKAYELKLGDKLLQVNGMIVENQQDVMESISNFEEFPSLLFERNDFQFFIRVY